MARRSRQEALPLHSRLEAQGAVRPYNGWERANWFAKAGDDTVGRSDTYLDRVGPWEPRSRKNAKLCATAAAFSQSPVFRGSRSEGPGARDLSTGLTAIAAAFGRPGQSGLFRRRPGRIVTEMSVDPRMRRRDVAHHAATAQWHDTELSVSSGTGGYHACPITPTNIECLLVTGPKSRDDPVGLSRCRSEAKWLAVQSTKVAGEDACSLRVPLPANSVGRSTAQPDAPRPFGMRSSERARSPLACMR